MRRGKPPVNVFLFVALAALTALAVLAFVAIGQGCLTGCGLVVLLLLPLMLGLYLVGIIRNGLWRDRSYGLIYGLTFLIAFALLALPDLTPAGLRNPIDVLSGLLYSALAALVPSFLIWQIAIALVWGIHRLRSRGGIVAEPPTEELFPRRRIRVQLWLAGISLFLLLAVVQMNRASETESESLIVPGQRIGKWTLALTIDDLERMKPPAQRTEGGTTSAGYLPEHTVLEWPSSGIYAVLIQGTISPVYTSSVKYRTERGIAVYGTREAVLREYGTPTAEFDAGYQGTRLLYDNLGVVILWSKSGHVTRVGVFRPGTAKTLWRF